MKCYFVILKKNYVYCDNLVVDRVDIFNNHKDAHDMWESYVQNIRDEIDDGLDEDMRDEFYSVEAYYGDSALTYIVEQEIFENTK